MLYHTLRALAKCFLRIRFNVQIKGVENIPEGPCILAMNHTSNYDPIIVGAYTPRKMRIMAKEELFRFKMFGRLITKLGAFPVKRGQADLKSLRYSLQLLKEGEIFAIFIEGTRSKTGEIQEAKKGIGFIAARSQAPVVPTYIYGVKRGWFKPAGVVFGAPLQFSPELSHEEIANRIADELRKLKQESDEA